MKDWKTCLAGMICLLAFASLLAQKPAKGSCERGLIQAQKDARKGKFILPEYGLNVGDTEFEAFSAYWLLQEYGIKSRDLGCVITEEISCYRDEMIAQIQSRKGQDFFERAEAEARAAYTEQVRIRAEAGEIFTRVDSQPTFPGGMQALQTYFLQVLGPDRALVKEISFRLVVEPDGGLSQIRFSGILGNEPLYEKVEACFREMPPWQPGLYCGQPVRTAIRMEVNLGD